MRCLRILSARRNHGGVEAPRKKKICSLSDNPQRARGAAESGAFDEPIRELLYGSANRGVYRILFTVLGRSVFILHVRHGSMPSMERIEFER